MMLTQKTGHVTIRLTPRQARYLWNTLDGVGDAGACEDGLTPAEQRSNAQIMDKLLPFMLARR